MLGELSQMEMDTDVGLISLKDYIAEQSPEKPYKLLILVHSTPDDPNKTGVILEKESKKIDGVEVHQFEVNLGYPTYNEKGNIVLHNYDFIKDVLGDKVKEIHDVGGFEVDPDNTICMIRGSDEKVYRFAETVRLQNVPTINSRFTHMVCDDKWINYVVMRKEGLRQPRTALVKSEKTLEVLVNQIGGKFPLLLKTAKGTQGIGVIFIESEKSLIATLQLINKLEESAGVIIQEFIKTDYDARVMVFDNEVVASLKRPVLEGDFRSNISQGVDPQKLELTDLEKEECIKAAMSVKAKWVGVDFIPSKNRETEKPYIIEINSSPGTGFINELNNINIHKMILEHFKNRDNWT